MFHETSHITWITVTIALTLKILKDSEGEVQHNNEHTEFASLNNFYFRIEPTTKEYFVREYLEIIRANTNKIPILLKFYLLFGLLEYK